LDIRAIPFGAGVAQAEQSATVNESEDYMVKAAALVIAAVMAGYGFHALAQGRIDARQQLMAIGTSSSNGISFIWFYEPTERTVHVCRTGQGGGDPVDCKAKTTLP